MKPLRFYEKNPTLKQAVESLFRLPGNVRSVVAKGFNRIAERDFNVNLILGDIKSLGAEQTLALYKSRLNRRPYDEDPHLHKAMNYLMVMPPSDQWFIAKKLQEMVVVMEDYLHICKTHSLPVQIKIAEEIAATYVDYGLMECKEILTTVKREFARLFWSQEKNREAFNRLDDQTFWLEGDSGGMRIRTKLDFA
jgi:hypothetical protein